MLLLNLRKAYLGFILSLLNVGMDAVFISDCKLMFTFIIIVSESNLFQFT
jgi:hypothetical protein